MQPFLKLFVIGDPLDNSAYVAIFPFVAALGTTKTTGLM